MSAVLYIAESHAAGPNSAAFTALRQARPARLYLAGDQSDELDALRTIIDWPCVVATQHYPPTTGERFIHQYAIDWLFEQETEGVVLAASAKPIAGFLDRASWGLQGFRDDHRVWQIELGEQQPDLPKPAFVAITPCRAWATWRDRWRRYQGNPFYLWDQAWAERANWPISRLAKLNQLARIAAVMDGLDTWRIQWQTLILNQRGLCLLPGGNPGVSPMPAGQLDANKSLSFERRLGLHRLASALTWWLGRLATQTRSRVMRRLKRLLFGQRRYIVVASSGRAGSTLLHEAIARGYIHARFGIGHHSWLTDLFIAHVDNFTLRLEQLPQAGFPVRKTHDLFDSRYRSAARFVFIHGDPLESAQSAAMMTARHGPIWLDRHLYHLRANGTPRELFQQDILNYQRQLETWLGAESDSVLCIAFERLWQTQDRLSRHLGFEVRLPPRRDRRPKPSIEDFNPALFSRLRQARSRHNDP